MADDALRGDLANVSDAAKGAALVGYLSSGQGAIGNTVSDKLNECVSVLDFGARPNNALDPVSVWLSGTEPRFASFADLQTAYPHVTSLTQSVNWAAFQAAANYFNQRGGYGEIIIPAGRDGYLYHLDDEVVIQVSGVTVRGTGGKIITRFPNTSQKAFFRFESPVAPDQWYEVTAVPVPSNIFNEGRRTLTTTVVTPFQPGDQVEILSSNYFSGIAGQSGYAIKPKGEHNVIQSVSGNTVILSEYLKDTYVIGDGETLRIRKVTRITDCAIVGLKGRGSGVTPEHQAQNAYGVRFFYANYVDRFSVCDNDGEGFSRFFGQANNCLNVIGHSNKMHGWNLALEGDRPAGTVWFTGINLSGCESVSIRGNTATNMRRPCDMDSAFEAGVGYTIPTRSITIEGNTSVRCQNVIGGHFAVDITIIGNTGVGCVHGIGSRGYNVTIIGNTVGRVYGTVIGVGQAPDDMTYTESPTAGRVTIIGNRGSGANGVAVSAQFDSMLIKDNTFSDIYEYAVGFHSKVIRNALITGNVFNSNANVPNAQLGFAQYNPFSEATREIRGLVIADNVFNGFPKAVIISGCAKSSPAEDVIIERNHFNDTINQDVELGTSQVGVGGWFGRNVRITRNYLSKSVFSSGIGINRLAADNSLRFAVEPRLEENIARRDNDNDITLAGFIQATTIGFANATYPRGARLRASNPVAGGVIEQVCVMAGTVGTLVATTGSISSGSNQLTLNNQALSIGNYISIAGAGTSGGVLNTRVLATAGSVVTVANNASTSVSDAEVSFIAPVFKAAGTLDT